MANGIIPTKTCNKCGETKALNCFYASPTNKDRKQGHCKSCDHKRKKSEERERAAKRKRAWEVATTKPCGHCRIDKPFSAFARSSKGRWKLRSWCRKCEGEHYAKISKDPKFKKKRAAYAVLFNEKNPAYNLFASRERKKKDPVKVSLYNRKALLKKRYGITMEEYDRMFSSQSGICPICGTNDPGGNGGIMVVDHDHETGKVRDLLCHKCNAGIGYFGDNPEQLRKAATYLEKHRNGTP